MGALSSVMITAGAGLLPNPPNSIGAALSSPASTGNAITAYNALPPISTLQGLWGNLNSLNVTGNISSSTMVTMLYLAANTFPALTNTLPPPTVPADLLSNGLAPAWSNTTKYVVDNRVSYENNVYLATASSQNQLPTLTDYWTLDVDSYGLTNIIDLNVNVILGNDLSIFCQAFMGAQGYVSQANATLNAIKSSEIIGQTFTSANGGMNNLTTGGLNQVSSDLQKLSGDLVKLGKLINFAYLDLWGLPGELVAQMGRSINSVLPVLKTAMIDAGVTSTQIQDLARGKDTLDSSAEKLLYTIMTKITGADLEQILAILGVTTSNITSMAQLLDPVMIFPNSYQTLLCPTGTELASIYILNSNNQWAVNTALISVVDEPAATAYTGPSTTGYETLKLIIPPDQALANKAFVVSLQQIKNIASTTLPSFARATGLVETNTGLTQVNNLTTPIPSDVGNVYKQQLGSGSGPNGTLLLIDVIGAVTSPLLVSELSNVTSSISNVNSAPLLSVYSYMGNTIAGDYDDPSTPGSILIPAGPAAGTYGNIDLAFSTGLIPAANSAITGIVANNSSIVSSTGNAWGNIIAGINREKSNQTLAGIDFGNMSPNSSSATMSFTTNLHDYGVDVAPGGANEIITALANTACLSGQSLLSSLREGRNLEALQSVGINMDSQLPG